MMRQTVTVNVRTRLLKRSLPFVLITSILSVTSPIASPPGDERRVNNASGELSCKPFRVFDGTMYSHKPDTTQFGIDPIRIIYAQELWPNKKPDQSLPPQNLVRTVSGAVDFKNNNGLIVLDVEQWRLETMNFAAVNIPKYTTLAKWVKEAAPSAMVGYFGMFPLPDYQRASMSRGLAPFISWQVENMRLKVLGEAVDVLFPEAYTPPTLNRTAWVKYTESVIQEARKFGKTVYVFLWPEYYETGIIGGRYLPTDYWALQLNTARRYADGLVIWGGWDQARYDVANWDDNAPWWKVTKSFLEEVRACKN